MRIYHGSTAIVEEPSIIRCEIGSDFGYGFYTTDNKEQANSWAKRRAMFENRKGIRHAHLVINIYECNDCSVANVLKIKEFDGITMEWLDMIVNWKRDLSHAHPYDIVIGKIINDDVSETLSYVLQGFMKKEEALERLEGQKINNQIAFCSEKALSYLTYQGYLFE